MWNRHLHWTKHYPIVDDGVAIDNSSLSNFQCQQFLGVCALNVCVYMNTLVKALMSANLSVKVPVGLKGVYTCTQTRVVEGEADRWLWGGQAVVAGWHHAIVVLPHQVFPLLPLHQT